MAWSTRKGSVVTRTSLNNREHCAVERQAYGRGISYSCVYFGGKFFRSQFSMGVKKVNRKSESESESKLVTAICG